MISIMVPALLSIFLCIKVTLLYHPLRKSKLDYDNDHVQQLQRTLAGELCKTVIRPLSSNQLLIGCALVGSSIIYLDAGQLDSLHFALTMHLSFVSLYGSMVCSVGIYVSQQDEHCLGATTQSARLNFALAAIVTFPVWLVVLLVSHAHLDLLLYKDSTGYRAQLLAGLLALVLFALSIVVLFLRGWIDSRRRKSKLTTKTVVMVLMVSGVTVLLSLTGLTLYLRLGVRGETSRCSLNTPEDNVWTLGQVLALLMLIPPVWTLGTTIRPTQHHNEGSLADGSIQDNVVPPSIRRVDSISSLDITLSRSLPAPVSMSVRETQLPG